MEDFLFMDLFSFFQIISFISTLRKEKVSALFIDFASHYKEWQFLEKRRYLQKRKQYIGQLVILHITST